MPQNTIIPFKSQHAEDHGETNAYAANVVILPRLAGRVPHGAKNVTILVLVII